MGEAEREKLEKDVLSMKEEDVCSVDCWISDGGFGSTDKLNVGEIERSGKTLDGWVLPLLEVQRVRNMRETVCQEESGFDEFYTMEEGDDVLEIKEEDLRYIWLLSVILFDLIAFDSRRMVNVHGVLLLRGSAARPPLSLLIPIPTSVMSLRALALHVSMRVPTLLTSAPSAGKALLLDHLAALLYPSVKNQVVSIHLADTSLDPRSLFGSYISSPMNPGCFEWKEGTLVRAMREGRWVVFEDIDRGSTEVLGILKPLVESLCLGNWVGAHAKLDVPSRGIVVAHQNFLVFATRSTQPSRNGKFALPTFFGAHKFCEIIVGTPEGAEVKEIVEKRFAKLAGSAARASINLWEAVRNLGEVANVRSVGLRELGKLCARVERLLSLSHPTDSEISMNKVQLWQVFTNPTLREEIYLEARDVFFGAGATTTNAKAHLDQIASIVGEELKVDEEKRMWLVNERTPTWEVEKDSNGNVVGVSVGRTRLTAIQKTNTTDSPPLRPFAMHKPAIRLLSSITTSVNFSEPILLTGETGTGKTSIITYLASLLGRSLISLNLSHQTESSDLIGGLKPIDTRVPAAALQERFLDLFGMTFSRKKNERFEIEVRKAISGAKWKRVVSLWRECGRLFQERLIARKVEERRFV